MTISSATNTAGPFAGNGSATAFPFAFKVFSRPELVFEVTDAAGTVSAKTLDSDFSVSLNADQDANPGGTITYPISGTPLATGETAIISTDLPYTQLTDITNAGGFLPQVIEDALDRNVRLMQQQAERTARSVRAPLGESMANLPPAAERANMLLTFDDDGDPVAVAPAAQSATALQALLAGTASGEGASMVGREGGGNVQDVFDAGGSALVPHLRPEAGAIAESVGSMLDKQLPSIMSIIPTALHAAIYSRTSTADVSSYFQTLINLGKPFTVPSGAKFRFNSSLNWVSGAKMFSHGDDYIVNTQHDFMTKLEFDSSLCTSGVVFAPATGELIQDWGFDGFVWDTTGTGAAYASFNMWDIKNAAGGGVFHFKLGKNSIQHCYKAIDADDGFFSGDLGDLSISFCVRGITKTTNNFATSLTGTVKHFHVFSGFDLANTTYCDLRAFFDFCGLQAVLPVTPPAAEMPVLCRTNASSGINFGYFGVENSKAIRFRLENYSTVEANIYEYQPAGQLWESSATRVSNIIQAEQGLFSVKSSLLKLKNYRVFYSTANGYPTAGAWGSGTSYFYWAGGDASTRISFENSILDMTPYQVCVSGAEVYMSAPRINNGLFSFGAAGVWRQDFNYANGYLTVGSTTYTNDFHLIQRNRNFVEGDEGFRMTPALSASSLRFFAVNGVAGNGAIAALKVPAAASNSRAINAGGTVNASGADYAEYERNNGLRIAKGQIVGFRPDGTLTLTYSEAVRFGVKSTDPSYVGGDTWSTAVEPEDGAPPEEWEIFRARLEADRQMVDRIAYSGKVPCNVLGATPGHYIIAEHGPRDTIVGTSIASPDLKQYQRAIGRVNRILADGRCEIAVMVH